MMQPHLRQYPSPNFSPRLCDIDSIILHGTGMDNTKSALRRLCHKAHKVSCHYLIDYHGHVYQLVKDNYSAWHAGVSAWGAMTSLNQNSIGIELFNSTAGNGKPYTLAQYKSLAQLLYLLISRYAIPLDNILGHSDIASIRESNCRTDPGRYFCWQYLYERGLAQPLPVYKSPSSPILWDMGYRGRYENRLKAYYLRVGEPTLF